ISIPFRVFVVVISLVAVSHCASRGGLQSLDGLLTLLWFFYLVRLIWDLSEVPPVVGADKALQLFIVTVGIPVIAVAMTTRCWCEQNVSMCLLTIGTVVSVACLWMSSSGLVTDQAVFEQRLGFEKVNPISLGHVATTTLLAALVLGTDRRSIFFRGVMIACAGVALWLLYKAGSRGPIVSLGACLAAYVLPRKTWA